LSESHQAGIESHSPSRESIGTFLRKDHGIRGSFVPCGRGNWCTPEARYKEMDRLRPTSLDPQSSQSAQAASPDVPRKSRRPSSRRYVLAHYRCRLLLPPNRLTREFATENRKALRLIAPEPFCLRVRTRVRDSVSVTEAEDWTQELLLLLEALPSRLKYRRDSKEDVMQTFAPERMHGANEARFRRAGTLGGVNPELRSMRVYSAGGKQRMQWSCAPIASLSMERTFKNVLLLYRRSANSRDFSDFRGSDQRHGRTAAAVVFPVLVAK